MELPSTMVMRSQAERFADSAQNDRVRSLYKTAAIVAGSYHFISLGLGYLIYQGPWRTIMLPAHAFLAIFSVAIRTKVPKSMPSDRRLELFFFVYLAAFLAYGASALWTRLTPEIEVQNVTAGDALMMIFAIFAILFGQSVSRREQTVLAACYVLIALPGMFFPRGDVMADCFVWSFPAAAAAAFLFRFQLESSDRRAAISEYRRLRAFTPVAIIERAIGTHRPVEDLFSPEDRFCVCICSDWRSYQKLTATMAPDRVVKALEHYYETCNTLLNQSFPRGNYFSDWIADELFVVAFAEGEESEAAVARASLQFARDLLRNRGPSAAETGVPKAIDVGIAAGHASVGIMGPEGGRKATALGEVPGRSRRLQTAAKLIREHHGEMDKAVIGAEVASLCGTIPGLMSFEVAANSLRDVTDKTLLFIEVDSIPA